MPLKRTSDLPPGGFIYAQQDGNGRVIKNYSSMSPFIELCREILLMRTANKLDGATIEQVMQDVDEAQCQRLGFSPDWCVQKKTTINTPGPLRQMSQRVRAGVEAAKKEYEKLSKGAAIIAEWLGAGAKPVAQELAQARSDVCTGRLSGVRCPHNAGGGAITESVAAGVRDFVEAKNHLKLTVEGEADLQSCMICGCFLGTKIWTPLKHIVAHTSEDELKTFRVSYPPCWINQEQNTPAQP